MKDLKTSRLYVHRRRPPEMKKTWTKVSAIPGDFGVFCAHRWNATRNERINSNLQAEAKCVA